MVRTETSNNSVSWAGELHIPVPIVDIATDVTMLSDSGSDLHVMELEKAIFFAIVMDSTNAIDEVAIVTGVGVVESAIPTICPTSPASIDHSQPCLFVATLGSLVRPFSSLVRPFCSNLSGSLFR